MISSSTFKFAFSLSVCAVLFTSAAFAEESPDAKTGEIKIGRVAPLSGAASAFVAISRVIDAYIEKVNAEGGLNGRKIKLITYDDNYSPPKTVEQVRKLVESDEVLFIFNSAGTANNAAIQRYLNGKKIPHLFLASGASRWNDPAHFPWTMGWQPNYAREARLYADYVLKTRPEGKIAILYQNDDYGREFVRSFKETIGSKLPVVAELSYLPTDPTIESQMISLKASGADVFYDISTPKFAAQAITKMVALGWKPLHVLDSLSNSVEYVLKPVGLENVQGLISAAYLKDPSDPSWRDNPGYLNFTAFMDRYASGVKRDAYAAYGYTVTQTLIEVLKRCGDDLSRDNVMKQASSLKNLELDLLLPGISIKTSPTDFEPLTQLQLEEVKDDRFELVGSVSAP